MIFGFQWHYGRSFSDTRLEDVCPCKKEACGLVSVEGVNSDCLEHPMGRMKTIRQAHMTEDCPGHK